MYIYPLKIKNIVLYCIVLYCMRLSEVILSYRELRDGSLFMRMTGSGKK